MIQLVINSNLLREIDDRALINRYAKLYYDDKESVENDTLIKLNLEKLLDWDNLGDTGVPVYCGKFESIKRKDWQVLINFIKDNKEEIKQIAYVHLKNRKFFEEKNILNALEKKKKRDSDRCTDENYKVSGRGKKARTCEYNGKLYKSRQECMYKEGISQSKLYRYLEKTGQV